MVKDRVKAPLLVTAALLLAGCANPTQQPQLNILHHEVGKLNNQMQQLTAQASLLEQQNSLNGGAAQGAWLLPATHTAVVLQSQAGDLRLSLGSLQSDADGTRVMLHIHAVSDKPLPALSAQVEWGEADSATGKPLEASSQSQTLHLTDALLPGRDAAVSLSLKNVPPEQLGYVRIHDIQLAPSEQPATPAK